MAGSQPIYQSRNRDSRFNDALQRPLYVVDGVIQNVDNHSIDGPALGNDEPRQNNRIQPFNRIVDFEGDKYWWHNQYVRVNVPGSGWTLGATNTGGPSPGRGVQIFPVGTDYQVINLGLFPITDETTGQQKLVALFVDDDFNRRLGARVKNSKFTSDGQWSSEILMTLDTNAINSTTAQAGWGYYGRIGNKVYLQFRRADRLERDFVEVDLNTITASQITASDTPTNLASTSGAVTRRYSPDVFCPYSGIMWLMQREGGYDIGLGSNNPRDARTSWYIERPSLTPGVDLVLISGLAPDGAGPGGSPPRDDDWWEGRAEMFVDPDEGKMYALNFIRGSGDKSGFACWQMRYDSVTDSLINEGDVGWNVLPPILRMQDSSNFTFSHTSKWKAYNLVDESGTSSIVFELMKNSRQGNLVNTYLWNGPNVEMSFLGQGGDAAHSRSMIKIGGGEYVSSPRKPYDFTFRVDASGAPAGTLNMRTRVLGSGQPIKIRWYFTDKSVPMQRLALVQNASSGNLVGNELRNVIASSGIEYVVQWRIQDQGVPLANVFDIHPVAENA